MKLLTKSLSILAIGGIFAGTALAGPGDAFVGFPAASIAKANAEKKTERRNKDRFRPVRNGTSFTTPPAISPVTSTEVQGALKASAKISWRFDGRYQDSFNEAAIRKIIHELNQSHFQRSAAAARTSAERSVVRTFAH